MAADKWKFCENKTCPYCDEEIEEEYVADLTIVTSYPYCRRSYVD